MKTSTKLNSIVVASLIAAGSLVMASANADDDTCSMLAHLQGSTSNVTLSQGLCSGPATVTYMPADTKSHLPLVVKVHQHNYNPTFCPVQAIDDTITIRSCINGKVSGTYVSPVFGPKIPSIDLSSKLTAPQTNPAKNGELKLVASEWNPYGRVNNIRTTDITVDP